MTDKGQWEVTAHPGMQARMAAGALGRAGVVARLVDQRPRRPSRDFEVPEAQGSFLPHTCYSHTTLGKTKILCIRNGPVSPLISVHGYTKSLPTPLSLGWAHSPTSWGVIMAKGDFCLVGSPVTLLLCFSFSLVSLHCVFLAVSFFLEGTTVSKEGQFLLHLL